MYVDLGKVTPGKTLFVPFQTFDSNDPSASVTITGLATTDIEVYKDASMTQRASDAGYVLVDTDGIDLDSTTGIHGVTIDLANNTTAGFWAAGSDYVVVIASITVDAATINFIPIRFRIGYDGAILETTIATLASQTSFTLTAGSADDDAYNRWKVVAHDVASAIQICIGYVSDYEGSTKTVTLAADPGIFAMVATDNISLFPPDSLAGITHTGAVIPTVSTLSGHTAQTGDSFARLAAYRLGELMSAALASQPFATSLLADLTQDDPDNAGTQQFTTAALDRAWDVLLTGATHNIATSAGRRLRGIQEFQGYSLGSIWIDTVNGTAGTTDYENGTVENPVDTIADANTLAASLGFSRFQIAPGSSITFAASQQNQVFEGHSWTLALGGQNIDGTSIVGAAVTGVCTSTAGTQYFVECNLGAVTIPDDTHVISSGIGGTQTAGDSGANYFYVSCHSAIAGTGSNTFDFGAANNASNLNVRHNSGGWTAENMGAGTGTYNATFEGEGQIVWAASCSATSNASVRGKWKVTDNAGGAVTVTYDDDTQNNIEALADTNELQGDWTDGGRLDLLLDAVPTNTEMLASFSALNDIGSTEVKDQVVAGLNTDTYAEPGQGVPPATASIATKIGHIYKQKRNKRIQTAALHELYDDAGTTVDQKNTISYDSTALTVGETAAGP